MIIVRRFLLVVLIAAAAAAGLIAYAPGTHSTEADKGFLADFVSRALSTPASRVSIGAVDGVLSSDSTIRDVTIADRDGVWLKLDQVRLVWSRLALLSRRLEVDRLEIGNLQILRKPLPAEEEVPGADQPLLPELPLKVEVKKFALQELALGEPILGVAARVTATGDASLGSPSEGLRLNADVRRLDAPGTLVAQLLYASDALNLNLTHDEPAGGILARALNIPGLPPVKLTLRGSGSLDVFDAQLAFDAGATIGATGQAQLRREAAVRRLNLNLDARVEGLLPPIVGPVFSGTTQLRGQTLFADDGAITIPALSIASQTARLDASGQLGKDRAIDLKIGVRAIPGNQGKTIAGAAEIEKLVFDGSVSGSLDAPRVNGVLAAQNASLPIGRFAKLDATFSALPNGPVSEPSTRIDIAADMDASGVALADAALATAVGDTLKLTFRASAARDGATDVHTAQLSTPTVKAEYTGQLGTQDAMGALQVNAADLSRFGDIASLALRGSLKANAEVKGLLSKGPTSASLNGEATRFATGMVPVDGLVDGRLSMSGIITVLRNGDLTFQPLNISGNHVNARVTGDALQDRIDLQATIDIPELRHADARLKGKGQLVTHLTGTRAHPNADIRAIISDARALDRPIPHLELDAAIRDLTGLLDARLALSGEVDRKPADGKLHLTKLADGGWRADEMAIVIGSVTANGNAAIDGQGFMSGKINLDARDLDDLSPLVLTRLSGAISANIELDAADGRQNLTFDAKADRLRAGATIITKLTANGRMIDLYRKPVIDGRIAIDQATIAGETFSQIRLSANGAPGGSDLSLSAEARGFNLDAKGRLVPVEPIRFEIASFVAQRGNRRIALAQPASLVFADGAVVVQGVTIAVDSGRISVDGKIGSTLDLRVNGQAVPLSAADIIVPGSGFTGTVSGDARVTGIASAPTGDWRLRASRIGLPQTRDLGLPPLDVTAEGRLADGRTTLSGTLEAGRAGSLRASGSVPLSDRGALDLTAQGRIDLGLANSLLSVSGRRVTGLAALELRARGTMRAPSLDGSLTLSNGSFTDAEQGIRLQSIQGRIAVRGTDITIERMSAVTPSGGSLTASGRVDANPAAGFPGDIRIAGQRAQLVSNSLVTAAADLSLTLSGPLARNPRVAGQIGIVSMEVRVPESLSTISRPIAGTKHINPTREAAARLALAAQIKKAQRRAPPFNAVLDLTIAAPSRIFVRGRGIDAELGGDLRLTGTLAQPIAIGAFDLRRGRLAILGKRLDFTRGRVSLTGDLIPELDFVAETRSNDVTAYIAVTGPANAPQFAFSSDPTLPQDEVLSQILFSSPSGGLSATQALQLAQAAAQFSGGGGDDVFEKLRRSLGVDNLDISLGAEGGPTVGLSRAISDRVSVGVKAGASAEDSGISVDIDVTKRIRIQGEVGATGDTSVGVGAEWEY